MFDCNRRAFGRKTVLFLGLLFMALFLTACIRQPIRIEGRVIETSPGGEDAQAIYFVRTEKGETKCIALNERTFIDPDVNGLEEADVRTCRIGEIMVCADCNESRDEATLDDGTLVQVYPADAFFVTSRRTEKTTVMEDGTEVEIWESKASMEYRLKDGTMVLRAGSFRSSRLAPEGPVAFSGPERSAARRSNVPSFNRYSLEAFDSHISTFVPSSMAVVSSVLHRICYQFIHCDRKSQGGYLLSVRRSLRPRDRGESG